MGNATALLISALAVEARELAACPVFGNPRDWGEPNGIELHPAAVGAASSRESGYAAALELARALLLRALSAPAADDVARLASEILVHGPTLARMGERAYAERAIHVPRRVIRAASRGMLLYLV